MPTGELVTESNSPDRSGFSRRDLLGNAALIGAGFAVGPLWFAACADQSKDINNWIDRGPDRGASDMKTRKLGTLEVSELGSGVYEHQRQLWTSGRPKPGHHDHP
jgi:hypothetical protein